MFFNIVKIYQSTQAVLNLAVFQSSFLYKDEKRKYRWLIKLFYELIAVF